MSSTNASVQCDPSITLACLTSCPIEILSLIADQAHLQDEAFRIDSDAKTLLPANAADLAAREDPYHFIKQQEWKWYGKSTMALGSTCTAFRKLCLPFLFKILPLSKTTTSVFHLHIKKQHGHSFKTIIFDVSGYSEGQTATEGLCLHTLADLPSVQSFIFSSTACVGAWYKATQAHTGVAARDLTSLRAVDAISCSAVRDIAQKITFLQIGNCEVDYNIISGLPSLKTFELIRTEDFIDWDELSALASCQSLSEIWLYLNTQYTSTHISQRWSTLRWSESLTSLKLEMNAMDDQDWSWLGKIATNLESLDLRLSVWQVATAPTKINFPQLGYLELWTKLEDMPDVLSRISAPILTDLVLYSRFVGEPFNTFIFAALEPLKQKLETFEFVLGDIVITKEQRAVYDAFVSGLPHAEPEDTSMWPQAVSIWKRASDRDFVPDERITSKSMDEAEHLLEYVRARLEHASKMGDGAGGAEWMRWMAPLAARRTLEGQ